MGLTHLGHLRFSLSLRSAKKNNYDPWTTQRIWALVFSAEPIVAEEGLVVHLVL